MARPGGRGKCDNGTKSDDVTNCDQISDVRHFRHYKLFLCLLPFCPFVNTEEESGKYFAVGELAGKDLQGGDDGNWKITQSAKYSKIMFKAANVANHAKPEACASVYYGQSSHKTHS